MHSAPSFIDFVFFLLARHSGCMPNTFASFVSSHSVLRSAAATRVLHLTVMGSLSDGGCTDAPGMLAGIGFRRSSSITILPLRKPDAHRRCSATLDGSPWHTRCLRSACPPSSFTAKPSALADARGYRCCGPWAHSCRCRRSTLYLPPLHRPSTSPEHKIPADLISAEILSNITAVLTSMGETDTACRIRSRTSASSPHNGKIALHIALF